MGRPPAVGSRASIDGLGDEGFMMFQAGVLIPRPPCDYSKVWQSIWFVCLHELPIGSQHRLVVSMKTSPSVGSVILSEV